MLTEAEFRDLNNEVVVPAYRQFCKENGLAFHFWDELPEQCFNLKIANRELELHKEAMDLFNWLKPRFYVFRNYIVTFEFTSWGGDFSYHAEPLDTFLRNLPERMETDGRCCSLYAPLVATTQIAMVAVLLAIRPRWLGSDWLVVALVGCLILGWLVCKWYVQVLPAKMKRRKAEALVTRLNELQILLNSPAK